MRIHADGLFTGAINSTRADFRRHVHRDTARANVRWSVTDARFRRPIIDLFGPLLKPPLRVESVSISELENPRYLLGRPPCIPFSFASFGCVLATPATASVKMEHSADWISRALRRTGISEDSGEYFNPLVFHSSLSFSAARLSVIELLERSEIGVPRVKGCSRGCNVKWGWTWRCLDSWDKVQCLERF